MRHYLLVDLGTERYLQLLPNLTGSSIFRRRATIAHPPLNHTRQHLKRNLRSSQRRHLPTPVECRRDFHHIRSHDIQPFNPPQNPDQLPRTPSARLRSTCPRRQTRINHIDVDAEVHRHVEANVLKDLARNSVRADVVNVVCRKADPALGVVVVIIAWAGQAGAQAGVDGFVVCDQGLVVCEPEHGAVREERLLRGVFRVDPGARVFGWVPGVEVGVEVDYCYGAVDAVEGSQGREGNAVVAAEGEEFRDVAVGVGGRLAGGGCGAVGKVCEGFAHLAQGEGVVEWRDGDVAAVDDRGPFLIWIETGSWVVAAETCLTGAGCADCSWAESGSGTVRD
jgi:hypothetical protein